MIYHINFTNGWITERPSTAKLDIVNVTPSNGTIDEPVGASEAEKAKEPTEDNSAVNRTEIERLSDGYCKFQMWVTNLLALNLTTNLFLIDYFLKKGTRNKHKIHGIYSKLLRWIC